jgi:NADH-ubiquinone oxidoreductase chain 5
MLIASLSLVAFPFMTGFYSKDFILESAYGQYYFSSTVVYIIATIGAMFTTLYSVKVLYLTFLTNPNGPLINYKQAHEGDIFMSLPLMILAVFSIFFGFITKDMFIGLGSGFFSDNALFIHPSHEIMLDTEFGVPTLFKLLPLIFTISLSVIAIVLSEYLSTILIYFKLSRVGYNIFSFLNQRFLIELFYNRYITGVILKLGGQTTKVIDKGSVEYLGPYGLEKGLLNISKNIARLNTGVITSYALYILIGLILYLLFNAYIHGSILILVLVISLSLVLFQSRKNITLTSVSLQSSTELQGLLARLNNFVQNIPSGEGMRTRAGDNVFGVADLAQNELKTLVKLKRDVVKLADIEAKQPNVTQDVAEHITSIKDEAINVAVRGGDIIIEGMQATAD